MQLLRRYSMIEEIIKLGSYSIHPVVHKWAYHYFYDEICKILGCTATILVESTVQKLIASNNLMTIHRSLPHVKACVERIFKKERGKAHDPGDKGKSENEDIRENAYLLASNSLTHVYQCVKTFNAAHNKEILQ